MWHYILFRRCRIKQILMYTHMIFDIVYFLHCCWYTFSHWQNGTVPISDMDHTPCPDRIDIKPDWQLVSQQIILKIWKFLYFRVHVLLSEQVHQSIWENLISILVSLISYCFSSYPIWWFILRLAGHGLFFVAEIVGFVVAEIVGYLLLCAKSAAALAAGSTAFFENCWSIWLNFANSHRSSPLSPPSRGDLHLIWLIALLYWYADKCYW